VKTVVIHGKVIKPISPRREFPDADLWGCTHTQQQYAKHGARLEDWSEWYDLHPIDPTPFYPGIRVNRPKALAWFQTLPAHDRPLYMLAADPRVPAAVRFPIEEIEAVFPPDPDEGDRMWTCQVDYMIAFAIIRGYERIVLHGHGVSQKLEHMIAHRGILYWIAVARTMGVRVTVLAPSWYRAPRGRYAYDVGGWAPKGRR
jgi:hypothetical protein